MKKDFFRVAALIGILLLFALAHPSYSFQADIESACFSPRGGCTEHIIGQIYHAKTEIRVQAYSFTSAPIAKALLNAHKRGINVQVILDKSQRSAKYTSATFLKNAGIPTYIDAAHAIAHNKVMIIDGEKVITGSFNFTKAAEEKNAENLLIIKSKELSKTYRENWFSHKNHSEAYTRQVKLWKGACNSLMATKTRRASPIFLDEEMGEKNSTIVYIRSR